MAGMGFLTRANGGHDEAAYAQKEIYSEIIETERKKKHPLEILDFGCGTLGTGRVFIDGIIRGSRDRLALYDPHTNINPPDANNIRIVGKESIVGPRAQNFDIINISYALCVMEPEEAMKELRRLRLEHPESVFIIIDYVLKGRGRDWVLRMLNSDAEKKWIEKFGEEEFVRTHTRYDLSTLLKQVQYSGLSVEPKNIRHLDSHKIRTSLISRPANEMGGTFGFM